MRAAEPTGPAASLLASSHPPVMSESRPSRRRTHYSRRTAPRGRSGHTGAHAGCRRAARPPRRGEPAPRATRGPCRRSARPPPAARPGLPARPGRPRRRGPRVRRPRSRHPPRRPPLPTPRPSRSRHPSGWRGGCGAHTRPWRSSPRCSRCARSRGRSRTSTAAVREPGRSTMTDQMSIQPTIPGLAGHPFHLTGMIPGPAPTFPRRWHDRPRPKAPR